MSLNIILLKETYVFIFCVGVILYYDNYLNTTLFSNTKHLSSTTLSMVFKTILLKCNILYKIIACFMKHNGYRYIIYILFIHQIVVITYNTYTNIKLLI